VRQVTGEMKIPALVTGHSRWLAAGLVSDGRQEIQSLREKDKEKWVTEWKRNEATRSGKLR